MHEDEAVQAVDGLRRAFEADMEPYEREADEELRRALAAAMAADALNEELRQEGLAEIRRQGLEPDEEEEAEEPDEEVPEDPGDRADGGDDDLDTAQMGKRRRAQRSYTRLENRGAIEVILERLPTMRSKQFTTVKKLCNIPRSTLYGWKENVTEDPSWRPWQDGRVRATGRSPVLTFEEEQEIQEHLDGLIKDGKQVALATVQVHIQATFNKTLPLNTIWRWLGFRGYSWRMAHLKKRSASTREVIERWLGEMSAILERYHRGEVFVLNLDETMWRFYPNGRNTWARVGTDSIQLHIDANEKDCFTAVGITGVSWVVLLWFIGKGKTKHCTRSFGHVGDNVMAIGESGWKTKSTLGKLIRHLRKMPVFHQTVELPCGRGRST
jgi:transposase